MRLEFKGKEWETQILMSKRQPDDKDVLLTSVNAVKICPLVSIAAIRAFSGLYPKDEISWPKISKDLRIALQISCVGWNGIWCQAMLKWLTLADVDAKCENVCEVPHGGEVSLLAAYSGCQWPSLHFWKIMKNHFPLVLGVGTCQVVALCQRKFPRWFGEVLGVSSSKHLNPQTCNWAFSHLAICSFFCMVMK